MSVQLDSAVGERLKFGEFELAPTPDLFGGMAKR